MELQLKIIGFLLIFLSLLHLAFPGYFNWKKELNGLALINRQMMYVHTFFIGLIILLMGLLCLTSPKEIMDTTLGNKIALGLSIFWGSRLITQFFWYSSKLWKGDKLRTLIHIIFSLFWAYLSTVFFIVFYRGNYI